MREEAGNRRRELGQPKRKRMKLEENEPGKDQEEITQEQKYPKNPKIKIVSPKKRKVGRHKEKPTKRARTNNDMRRYITCKRWREQKEKRKEEN